MKTETIQTYNWMQDVRPELLNNLNQLLEAKGIEPLHDIHGGRFKDGKWVGFDIETNDYRNYWHAYLAAWGERMFNDSYQIVYFPEHDNDEEWEYRKESLREWSDDRTYDHVDPNWTDDLVDAMRKIVKEHFPYDEKVVFEWSW